MEVKLDPVNDGLLACPEQPIWNRDRSRSREREYRGREEDRKYYEDRYRERERRDGDRDRERLFGKDLNWEVETFQTCTFSTFLRNGQKLLRIPISRETRSSSDARVKEEPRREDRGGEPRREERSDSHRERR